MKLMFVGHFICEKALYRTEASQPHWELRSMVLLNGVKLMLFILSLWTALFPQFIDIFSVLHLSSQILLEFPVEVQEAKTQSGSWTRERAGISAFSPHTCSSSRHARSCRDKLKGMTPVRSGPAQVAICGTRWEWSRPVLVGAWEGDLVGVWVWLGVDKADGDG